MAKINKKGLIGKLKPFWERRKKIYADFRQKEFDLEKEMNKKLEPKIELEFFYCDGDCVGIGAVNFSDRKQFPLIHDTESNIK